MKIHAGQNVRLPSSVELVPEAPCRPRRELVLTLSSASLHIGLLGCRAYSPFVRAGCSHQVGVGRDHTLFALTPGYLKFYSLPHDPKRPTYSPNMPNRGVPRSSVPIPMTNRPKGYRKYVGITLRRDDTLPRNERQLGRERLWFGDFETEKVDRTWEWQEEGADGEGRFIRTDAGAQDGAASGLDALAASEGAASPAEGAETRP
jgi:hypothetical protein